MGEWLEHEKMIELRVRTTQRLYDRGLYGKGHVAGMIPDVLEHSLM